MVGLRVANGLREPSCIRLIWRTFSRSLMRRALLSVSDKSGLVEFGTGLTRLGL